MNFLGVKSEMSRLQGLHIPTFLPVRLRNLVFQPSSLFWTLSMIPLQCSLVILPCREGTPRYLPKSDVIGMPTRPANSSALSLQTLLEKKILDLSLLIFCPENLQNLSRQSMTARICSSSASAKSAMSSAKKRWEMLDPFLEALIPFHRPWFTALVMICPSLSMQRTKRYGEIASPCLIPLLGLNLSSFFPS